MHNKILGMELILSLFNLKMYLVALERKELVMNHTEAPPFIYLKYLHIEVIKDNCMLQCQ